MAELRRRVNNKTMMSYQEVMEKFKPLWQVAGQLEKKIADTSYPRGALTIADERILIAFSSQATVDLLKAQNALNQAKRVYELYAKEGLEGVPEAINVTNQMRAELDRDHSDHYSCALEKVNRASKT